MTNRLLASGLIVCALLAARVYSQSDGAPEPAAASKGLRDAYARAFLIGAAGDIPRGYSEAELANIKANYNIVTPENCMKPRPTHPSEDTYNFTTPDALGQWCQDNGIQVWGHTLARHSQTAPWFFQAPASESEEATGPATPPENVMVSLTPPANVTRIKLYEKTPNVIKFPENELNPMEPTLDLYIPDADGATGAGVLLCPGGGYEMLTVPGEGGTIAEFFKAHNVAAFVLRYRHGPQYHYPTTLLDAQRALRHIKAHAKEYFVDPERVGVFGGSAGGHLAAMLATLFGRRLMPEEPYVPDEIDSLSARPAFALLLYPVIDLTDNSVTHKGSRTNLTQDNPDLYEALSPWKHVTGDTPPAFIVHGTNDFLVPVKNSLLYYEACLKARIPVEMHLLDTPMHGFGMGADLKDETVKDWPEQAVRFMERHTGTK